MSRSICLTERFGKSHAALLIGSICAAASLVCADPLNPPQPVYKGRPLAYWVQVLDGPSLSSAILPETTEIEGGREAEDALKHIGTNAIPFLLIWAQEDPPAVGGSRGLVQAFRALGPAARSAIPALASLLTNTPEAGAMPSPSAQRGLESPRTWKVLQALSIIGAESLPVLLALATNDTVPTDTRCTAIEAVRNMGTNGLAALPGLLWCMGDRDEAVVDEAVKAVGAVGVGAPAALGALSNALHASHWLVRYQAVEALGQFGESAARALVLALYDPASTVRDTALRILVRSAPGELTNSVALTAFMKGLNSAEEETRGWAARGILAAGQRAAGKKPSLAASEGPLAGLCLEATNVLRRLAPELLTNAVPP
jgi:HEAT repeat protein